MRERQTIWSNRTCITEGITGTHSSEAYSIRDSSNLACLAAGQLPIVDSCRIADLDSADTCCGSCQNMPDWPSGSFGDMTYSSAGASVGAASENDGGDVAAVVADRMQIHATETVVMAVAVEEATFDSVNSRTRESDDDQMLIRCSSTVNPGASEPTAWVCAWFAPATPLGFAGSDTRNMLVVSSESSGVASGLAESDADPCQQQPVDC